MNTKVEDNFVAHNLDTEFALFVVRTWEIWRRQGRAANQENLDEADFMETKFTSLPRSRGKQGGARSKTPQRNKYNPLGTQGEVTIEIQSFYRPLFAIRRHKTREQEVDWIAKGALVAFIYFGGFYTMISATMSNIMR
jgi:hypothetical protein